MRRLTLSRRKFLEGSILTLASRPLAAGRTGRSPKPKSGLDGLPDAEIRVPEKDLRYRGLFMHAWDLRDDGLDEVMGWMRNSGLNAMCLAATYHSGWFVHANNSRHRGFMTEGSVCYFPWHDEFFRTTKLRPVRSRLAERTDWFGEAGRRLDKHDLRLVAWTIGTHNTRLGLEYPEHTQRNVYGDSLPHALCPADDDVREYLKALCRDLAVHYPLWGLQLESFGWNRFAHGHHHERDLTALTPHEQELMALCVCPSCRRKAAAAGVDIGQVGEIVKATLDAAFREAPGRPKGHPQAMADLEEKSVEVGRFNAWREAVAASLIWDIKQESLKGTNCRLLLQTGYEEDLATAVDGFACSAYGKSSAETLEICRESSRAVPPDWEGEFNCYVRLGLGVPRDSAELRGIVEAVRDGGCRGLAFYNLSESPPKMLGWIRGALDGTGSPGFGG
jgi:hypothetical protein